MTEPSKTVLKNGLTVLLQESHNAPVVTMNLCCKVGSRYEGPKERGMCHLIEHMIFKGTPTYPVGEIARRVEASGGDINAYTSFDETVFYISMASRYVDEGLKILADAAINPLFDAEELAREKEVVVEEISRSDDSPNHRVAEDLFMTAFVRHAYGKPIAGSKESVRAITRQQLFSFYKKWYVAPNLIFVMVGDFDAPKMLKRIAKLFDALPSRAAPSFQSPREPQQRSPRAITRASNIRGFYLAMGFHIPELVHPDVPALDVLSQILSGGESSRLDQKIREEQGLVRTIDAASYTPQEPCLFLIDAELSNQHPMPAIRSILKETQRLHVEPVSPTELLHAKTNLRSAKIYEKETVEGLCRKLGFFEITAGDFAFEDEYYRNIEAVSPEKIQEVAGRYLTTQNLTLALCHPGGNKHRVSKRSLLTGLPKPKRVRMKKSSSRGHGIQLFRLSNGIRLIIKENRQVPLVAIRSASLGGTRFETARNHGISHLIAETSTKGTANRTALEVASQTEAIAGSLSGYSGRNIIGVRASFLSERLEEGIQLFTDVLANPSFDAAEVKKEKAHIITSIRDQDDMPARMAMMEFLRILFPKHPYRFPISGTRQSVRSLKPDQLTRTYRSWIQPKNLVISVVGDVRAEHIREVFSEQLEDLSHKKFRLPRPKAQTAPRKATRSVLRKKGKQQAHIILGFLGSTFKNPDRFGLDVMNAILAGQGGRLFIELRDKQGLAYTVHSSLSEGIEPGFISVYMGTDPEKLETALGGIKHELERFIKKPASKEELERAQRYLIGTYALELQRNRSIGALLAYDELYGLGYDDYLNYESGIQKVTRAQVQRLAKKYLRLDRSVTVIVKP